MVRLAIAVFLAFSTSLFAAAPEKLPPCTARPESGLPLPSTFARNNNPAAYQNILAKFLTDNTYEKLGCPTAR